MDKRDIVIPLLEDDRNNVELRFALRTLKNIEFDRVFVVGDKPNWLQNVTYIANSSHFGNRARNIMTNIWYACKDERLSSNFIFINDDYFFLKEINNFPYFYKGTIQDGMEAAQWGEYYSHLLATKMVLNENNLGTLNFDVHFPIVYNKDKMLSVIDKYNWDTPYGFTMKSLYCNTLGIEGIFSLDCNAYTDEKWETWTVGKSMFSINERSWSSNLENYLLLLFPDKSKFEK